MDEQKRQAAEKVEDVSLSGRTYLQLVTDGLKAVPFKESSFPQPVKPVGQIVLGIDALANQRRRD